LWDSQRTSEYCVVDVTGIVEWDQHVVRVVATIEESAYEGFVIGRGRSGLSYGVERAKGPESDKISGCSKRAISDEAALVDAHGDDSFECV
jgi:hypothetical protein